MYQRRCGNRRRWYAKLPPPHCSSTTLNTKHQLLGLWSRIREIVLERPFPPDETGDLAYRGTFTREQLKNLGNERIDKILEQSNCQVWLGPGRHAVFYPLRNHTEYNLVLL